MAICENHAADAHKTVFVTQNEAKWLLPGRSGFCPIFRQGDAVVLYERNTDTDNVTNKMVFKGNIERISDNEVCIRLRATQQNAGVLPAASLYAIEHDYMDTSFRSMYLGLSAFLSATQRRRDLLLGQRLPSSMLLWILVLRPLRMIFRGLF